MQTSEGQIYRQPQMIQMPQVQMPQVQMPQVQAPPVSRENVIINIDNNNANDNVNKSVNNVNTQSSRPSRGGSRRFKSNILNVCSAGPLYCILGCLFPAPVMAKARSKYDESNCCFNFFCLTPCANRNIIREGYGLNGNCITDILCTTICTPCSAIQAVAEVKKRGPRRQGM